ncbi:MAG: GGDEF domain-containing protein [Planctomycetes bacterium]|nr:GGDEF domain-containing protein [Planctomycetota bacterium]
MTRPGFRRSSTGGREPSSAASASSAGGEFEIAAPFSQAQILHLMKSEFGRARRHGYPLSCVLIRVDRIRELVATHGSELRDAVRRGLGRVVAEKTRDHDHVGLLSEDRFLLLLPHAGVGQAEVVARRVAQAFANLEIELAGQRLHPTLSLGIATNGDRDTLFFDTLVSQAELALDEAFRAGGDRVEVFRRERFSTPDTAERTE